MNEPVLADSSIWIASFRAPLPLLGEIARSGRLRMHPFIRAELALGSLPKRQATLASLDGLRTVRLASHESVLAMIEDRKLHGRGIGYIDAHLVAACLITPGAKLWTTDKALLAAAQEIGIAAQLTN